jgi:hypothetical protein
MDQSTISYDPYLSTHVLEKSEYRSTQTNRQHLDWRFTHVFTNLLVLKMQQMVKPF